MDARPDIINSPVISSEWDIFWEEVPELTKGMESRETLVFTLPVAAGSADFQQLQKIFQACELKEGDYNLIELTTENGVSWLHLREVLRPRYVILFGIEPIQLGISAIFMPHQVNRFQDICWIPTLSVSKLSEYPDIKKHLWNYGLKPVFVEKAFANI
jgi:hypothetical protein